jgi:hypothetical protein
MKAEASTPSIGLSPGTRFDAPTIPASVGSQSTAASISARLVRRPRPPVVAAQDEDRVVFDARFLDGIHHLTDPVVHLGDDVAHW